MCVGSLSGFDAFSLEFRKAKTAFEKALKGSLQIKLDVGQRQAVHLFEPFKFFFILGGCISQRGLGFFVMLYFIVKHFIPNKASTTKRLSKELLLLSAWIEPVFIGFKDLLAHF